MTCTILSKESASAVFKEIDEELTEKTRNEVCRAPQKNISECIPFTYFSDSILFPCLLHMSDSGRYQDSIYVF